MQQEIEAKFLHVDLDSIRSQLKKIGATLDQPMRLMRRVVFDYSDGRYRNDHSRRLRVRDEGNKVTATLKIKNYTNYAQEIEIEVDSFENTVALFEAMGLEAYSFQESKREAWHYKNVEIVLDVWPWVDPYIEIEGPDESSIQAVAKDLGLDWQMAKFGSADAVYKDQYPGMQDNDSIGDVAEVRFDTAVPEFLIERNNA